MTHEVKVTLHSPQGTRTTEVPPRGFPTRHIRTTSPQRDPGLIPSIFEPVETTTPVKETKPESTPENQPKTNLTALLADVDSRLGITTPNFYPERHAKQPRLYDVDGRPVMAVADVDTFLECQELVNATDYRVWRGASASADRRAERHSSTMNECRKYIVIAVHCLNKANRLQKGEVS